MGASPDHFGFGKLSKLVGIDQYYSEKEYGNPKDHDGTWGIFDHKFLPFAASVLKQRQVPFLSVIFNISSHHPFTLPVELQKQFSLPGQQPQQNSVSYVDYSLRLFFESIRTTEWYRNSIFVFVADHAVTFDVKPKPVLYTAFQIPFFIHIPGSDSSLQIDKTVQQLDLVPTVFDLLHYHQPFMSFGRSIFDPTDAFAVNKIFGNYQLIRGDYLLGYSDRNEESQYFYNFILDPQLQRNLLDDQSIVDEKTRSEQKLKGVIQRFNTSLTKHQLMVTH
jgi:phosphoglycerol transferase MdoB-like AlkP superfamily enzyme